MAVVVVLVLAFISWNVAGFGDLQLSELDDPSVNRAVEPLVIGVVAAQEAQQPTASLTVSPNPANPGEAVTLDASESTSAGGTVACDFDFEGDGTYDVFGDQDCIITHSYDQPGSYQPTVVVRDANQQSDSTTVTLTVAQNQPPDAAFELSSTEPTVDEPVTFDASASNDPDGTVVVYRWDFDGDGAYDVETGDATVVHAFDEAGAQVVTLQVEDDDGATDIAQTQFEVTAGSTPTATRGSPTPSDGSQAACSASSLSVAPGESVTLDASASTNAATIEFDIDGDGTYDRTVRDGFRTTVRYDEPGRYSPRARAVGPNGQTAVTDCGTVTVGGGNEPPVARFTHELPDPDATTTVTFNASESFDTDGTIVVYRWDFDNDGLVDATTAGPVVTHVYPEHGTYRVVLEVEDDDGATDDTTNPVELSSGGIPWQTAILILVGLLGGLGLCRGVGIVWPPRRLPVGTPAGEGVTAYAAGVFTAPAPGGSITVDDVGFEPDLVRLTASNAVVAGDATDQARGTTDGWSYGAARRLADGDIEQHVVAVADDAARPALAIATSRGDRSLALPTATDQGVVGGPTGRIDRTTADGFEFSVDTAAETTDTRGPPPAVLYRAFETDSPGDVGLGHVAIAESPDTEEIELDVPADFVTVVATNALDAVDESELLEGEVGVSVGKVVGAGARRQLVTAGAVVPGGVSTTVTAASDRRAVRLPGDGSVADSELEAAAIGLDEGVLTLEYDAPSENAHPETATTALLTYVGLHAGTDMEPALGHFSLPSPSAANDLSVDTGFAPGMVEFTVVDLDELGERTHRSSPFAFGRSHGVAISDPDGTVMQYRLSGAVDPDRPVDSLGAVVDSELGPGEHPSEPPGERLVAEAAGAGLAANGTGSSITGRDDLLVSRFHASGFDVRVSDVSTDGRDGTQRSDKLVFYTAWPRPDP